ncbi:RNA recognition motif family protein [Leishmania donovani]|uniref:RNA recognition motif family protein n=1 Tax=Leishmania donovani TaxID=5661 RepID=A0A504X9G6_LEIDO|nr:RNA recognition motif family protein [Leishmania donovani]
MGDRDSCSRRDSRADRYGGDSDQGGDDGSGSHDLHARRLRRSRTEGGDDGYGAPWQQQQFTPYMSQGSGAGTGFPYREMMPMNAPQGFHGDAGGGDFGLPFMSGGAPGVMPFGFGGGPSPNGNHQGGGRAEDRGDNLKSTGPNAAPAATRVLPSVEEFVPVVPKSLMNLVVGGGPPGSGDGNAAAAGSTSSQPQQTGNGQRGALELEDYFQLLLPEVRRLQTERQIRELAERVGLIEEEGEAAVRHVPATANLASIDEVKSLSVSTGRAKSFSFIELRLADMIDELVSQSAADPHRFLFNSSLDGQTYPLMIRRPRDADPLTGVDEAKVVLVGFPPSMPEESIKPVFESYGKLLKFELRNGYAYGEFEELRDATDFRADVHGVVLGNNMVVALPLYDWLKALLVREGIDVTIEDDDPVSGKYVMKQVRERLPETSALGGAGAQAGAAGGGGAAGGDAGAGGSSALVAVSEDPEAASLQIMRELLDMSFTLPDMLGRFAALYPHLRPLYANSQLTVYATPVLVLLNLFDEEELVYDSNYSQLLADIEEEVEKYGRVKRLVVPRREARPKLPEAPKPGVDYDEADEAAKAAAMAAHSEARKNFGAELGRYMNRQTHPVWGGYGRVFVEYETVDEAAEAQQRIAGKLFGERTVVTSFLFPELLKDTNEEAVEADAQGEDEKGAGGDGANEEAKGGENDGDGEAVAEAEREDDEAPSSTQPRKDAEVSGDAPGEVAATKPSVHTEDID